jgi:hypothetical protein
LAVGSLFLNAVNGPASVTEESAAVASEAAVLLVLESGNRDASNGYESKPPGHELLPAAGRSNSAVVIPESQS